MNKAWRLVDFFCYFAISFIEIIVWFRFYRLGDNKPFKYAIIQIILLIAMFCAKGIRVFLNQSNRQK